MTPPVPAVPFVFFRAFTAQRGGKRLSMRGDAQGVFSRRRGGADEDRRSWDARVGKGQAGFRRSAQEFPDCVRRCGRGPGTPRRRNTALELATGRTGVACRFDADEVVFDGRSRARDSPGGVLAPRRPPRTIPSHGRNNLLGALGAARGGSLTPNRRLAALTGAAGGEFEWEPLHDPGASMAAWNPWPGTSRPNARIRATSATSCCGGPTATRTLARRKRWRPGGQARRGVRPRCCARFGRLPSRCTVVQGGFLRRWRGVPSGTLYAYYVVIRRRKDLGRDGKADAEEKRVLSGSGPSGRPGTWAINLGGRSPMGQA